MAENVACMRMMGSACGINRLLTCKESAVYETYFAWIQVREENPILYSHKTQLNIKLSLLQHYNNMFRPKLSAIFRIYR